MNHLIHLRSHIYKEKSSPETISCSSSAIKMADARPKSAEDEQSAPETRVKVRAGWEVEYGLRTMPETRSRQ